MQFTLVAHYSDILVNVGIEAHSLEHTQDLIVPMFSAARPTGFSNSNSLHQINWDLGLVINISELSIHEHHHSSYVAQTGEILSTPGKTQRGFWKHIWIG